MSRPSLRYVAVIMALALITGHAAGIQLIAWAGMLIDRVQTTSIDLAIATTFDGDHPCCLCDVAHALNGGEQAASPEKSPAKAPTAMVAKNLKWIAPPGGHTFPLPTLVFAGSGGGRCN